MPTYRRCLLLPALLLAAAAVALLTIDVPLATGLRQAKHEADVIGGVHPWLACLGYLDWFELFGHGLGVVLVIFLVHQLDPARRWAIPRALVCAFGAGGAADLVKMTVVRCRPYDLPSQFAGSVWNTFGAWWPGLGAGSESQSFPSAHTATAFGLAAALVWLYPRGRAVFPLLAALVACQRVQVGAHYPSDVLVGAAVGCLVAALLLDVGLLPGWLDQLEQRWWPHPAAKLANAVNNARRAHAESVFLLEHVHGVGREESPVEDVKTIGIYSSRENAEAAKDRLSTRPGFSQAVEGFCIDEYPVDVDYWVDGYATV
ncbi:MAG: phosphatase PAP2 family protein [Thermoguttaceae bacterium]